MKICSKCGKTEKEALIYEILNRNGISNYCEECVKNERPIILKKPSEENAIRFALSKKPLKNRRDDFVENFHWLIKMARRRAKLSQKQLAEEIGTSEQEITKLEAGQLPESDTVVKKLENYFRIRLLKDSQVPKPESLFGDIEIIEDKSNESENML